MYKLAYILLTYKPVTTRFHNNSTNKQRYAYIRYSKHIVGQLI